MILTSRILSAPDQVGQVGGKQFESAIVALLFQTEAKHTNRVSLVGFFQRPIKVFYRCNHAFPKISN